MKHLAIILAFVIHAIPALADEFTLVAIVRRPIDALGLIGNPGECIQVITTREYAYWNGSAWARPTETVVVDPVPSPPDAVEMPPGLTEKQQEAYAGIIEKLNAKRMARFLLESSIESRTRVEETPVIIPVDQSGNRIPVIDPFFRLPGVVRLPQYRDVLTETGAVRQYIHSPDTYDLSTLQIIGWQ